MLSHSWLHNDQSNRQLTVAPDQAGGSPNRWPFLVPVHHEPRHSNPRGARTSALCRAVDLHPGRAPGGPSVTVSPVGGAGCNQTGYRANHHNAPRREFGPFRERAPSDTREQRQVSNPSHAPDRSRVFARHQRHTGRPWSARHQPRVFDQHRSALLRRLFFVQCRAHRSIGHRFGSFQACHVTDGHLSIWALPITSPRESGIGRTCRVLWSLLPP